jgi:hypothetical protein
MLRELLANCSVVLVLLGAVGMAACSESATPGGAVAQVTCNPDLASDCEGGWSCDPVKKVCVATLTCDDVVGPKCPNGKKCVNAECVPDFSGADVTDAGDSTAADTAETVEDVPVGSDVVVTPPDNSCSTCAKDEDCGADKQCIQLLSGFYCVKKCTEFNDCTSGFTCEKVSADSSTQKHCVLPSYDCAGCAVDGCGAGEKCNLKVSPPVCGAVKAQCEDCQLDKDCDNGFRCVKQGSSKVCAPDCSNGQVCPDKSTCTAFVGVPGKACAFQSAACCYGATCTVSCTGCSADKCIAGKCVDCTADSHCTGGSCNLTSHSCTTAGSCASETPIKLSTGVCVQCTNNTHCSGIANSPVCNAATNKCEASTASNECAACGGAYPGCVEINGTWSCVECTTHDDCKAKDAGTCSAKTYTCSGTVAGPGKTTGDCKSDVDCVNSGTTSFDLACDTKTGLCYDKAGGCDNVTAFCNAGKGSVCQSLTDMMSGGAGGLPIPGGSGLPSGGGPLDGKCTCGGTTGGSSGYTMKQECALLAGFDPTLKNCNCATDPTNANCTSMILGDCCQQSGGSTATDPIACMMAALAGGSQPDEACFGQTCSMGLGCFMPSAGGGQGSCGGSLF